MTMPTKNRSERNSVGPRRGPLYLPGVTLAGSYGDMGFLAITKGYLYFVPRRQPRDRTFRLDLGGRAERHGIGAFWDLFPRVNAEFRGPGLDLVLTDLCLQIPGSLVIPRRTTLDIRLSKLSGLKLRTTLGSWNFGLNHSQLRLLNRWLTLEGSRPVLRHAAQP